MNSNLLNRPIKNLFYVFGFGWCGDSPESVYVVPAENCMIMIKIPVE